ncbi:YbdD/YjiX family protein [Corynebacterium vitaeruminis]|uniref:YbdD/YjiX family protein n=1 Tax=Corynebacterium vitaeruminis DSM 20294 TaxID=1224164 RepID=W5Y271_9CORY|nr:YbdD/YjiX family protein [Corynebacterium vitaeruminis]AHI23019.1 hypothetical protein B843_08170 [Corynebacterium vitaeruminis DSM 20294]
MQGITKVAKSVWWYLGAIIGDHDYDNYVAHCKATHPGCEILSKKEYWRERYSSQENNPQTRCC